MPQRSLFLAAYDIGDDSCRVRALSVLRGWAVGGQRSAYELFLSDTERGSLLESMTSIGMEADARFALVRLDPRGTVYTLGRAVAPPTGRYFLIK